MLFTFVCECLGVFHRTGSDLFLFVPLDIICVNLPAKLLHKIDTVWTLIKLIGSLMRNNFPNQPSGAPLHTLLRLYDVPVGFVALPTFI